jgi:xanthine dehydrogenase YagT iron-sulfur-binding subunit
VPDESHPPRRPSRRDFIILGGAGMAAAAVRLPTPAGAEESDRHAQSGVPDGLSTRMVRLHVNGEIGDVDVEVGTTLLDALREHLGLTGTKKGCETGACGACTVLVDGRRVNACLTLAVMVEGAEVTTIEGIARGEVLHRLQHEIIEHDGLQCGYCTPGQIMSAIGYLAEGHAQAANPAVIREWMSGNVCRCGAYPNIVAAIAAVAGPSPEKVGRP